MEEFDVVVIGAGPGGYPAAIRSARLGRKCAIVEREALGGLCLNAGCIPTKTLMASAERYLQVCMAADLGVEVSEPDPAFVPMHERMVGVVNRLRSGVDLQLRSSGVEVISGQARFLSPEEIEVAEAEGKVRTLRAKQFILATGSYSTLPDFLPKSDRIVDSTAFLEQKTLPDTLLILGGGVVGCEFACLAAALGTAVTLVEQEADILPQLDEDVRGVVSRRMMELGIEVWPRTAIDAVEVQEKQIAARCGENVFTADELLVATGRRAQTDGLKLEAAGVQTDSAGSIPVDACGRTSVPTIFAVGDVTANSVQLAHAATYQGVVAAEYAAGMNREASKQVCPFCVFTIPEVAGVGMSEREARAADLKIRVGRLPFTATGRAWTTGETDGFVKWIAEAGTGRLLGAQVVGDHAAEMIAEPTLAIQQGLTVKQIVQTIHAHPTFSEAWVDAAWKIVE